MRRTAEDAAKTRVALLEAALMAFEEKGWRGATFEHIAERAGVTRGALHHHFRDKRTLLVEALEWGWSDYGQRLFDTVSPTTGDTGSADDETVALNERAHRAVEELLARFVRLIASRRGATNVAPRDIAGLVLVLLQGFTVAAVTRPDDLPQPDRLDATMAALVKGLLET